MAVVYSREIEDDIITLTPSGWTYGKSNFDVEPFDVSVFVLVDKETESLWFPADQNICTLPTEIIGGSSCGLVGIGGVYAGHVLEGIQTLSATTWSEWKNKFPDTKFVRSFRP